MKPVAKSQDHIVAVDVHMVVPEGGGKPEPMPLPFDGLLVENLSPDVVVEQRAIALVGSIGRQIPGHIVTPKSFAKPPTNEARVLVGSSTVLANNRPIARANDAASTCNDPADLPASTIIASSTVLSG